VEREQTVADLHVVDRVQWKRRLRRAEGSCCYGTYRLVTSHVLLRRIGVRRRVVLLLLLLLVLPITATTHSLPSPQRSPLSA